LQFLMMSIICTICMNLFFEDALYEKDDFAFPLDRRRKYLGLCSQ
jgi:hypothetical protein